MQVVVVIPAYNEADTIGMVIKRTKKLPSIQKVIVVDDGSEDGTADVSKKAGASVLKLPHNMGVGAASRFGLAKAISLKPDAIIFVDADGQLDPKYIPEFISKLRTGYDYVAGWRDLSNYPLDRKIGNWGLTLLTNILCPTGLHDTECGFRAMTLDAAKKMKLKGMRYEREMDAAYEAWRNKFKIAEIKIKVPVFHPKGAMIRGFKNFFWLLKRRFGLI